MHELEIEALHFQQAEPEPISFDVPSKHLGLSSEELLTGNFDQNFVIEKAINSFRNTIFSSPQITDAIQFALEAHSGKIRKVLKLPYVIHPFDTAAILSTITNDADIISAGILHDTVEDSPIVQEEKLYTIDMIKHVFNNKIAGFVDALTADDKEGREKINSEAKYWGWRNKKQEAVNKVISHSPEAILIKSADVLSNISDFRRDLKIVGKENKEKLFIPFKREQESVLARFTHTIIDLSIAYRDGFHSGANPLTIPLIDTQVKLIRECFNEDYDALYNDWIRDLKYEKEILRKISL